MPTSKVNRGVTLQLSCAYHSTFLNRISAYGRALVSEYEVMYPSKAFAKLSPVLRGLLASTAKLNVPCELASDQPIWREVSMYTPALRVCERQTLLILSTTS